MWEGSAGVMYLQSCCMHLTSVYLHGPVNGCVRDVPAMFPCSAKWVVMEFLVQPAATPHSVLHTVPRLRTPHIQRSIVWLVSLPLR